MGADLKLETLCFVEELVRNYLEEQDMEAVGKMLDEQSEWIFIGEEGLRRSFGSDPPAFKVRGTVLETSIWPVPIGKECCLVSGTLTFQAEEEKGLKTIYLSALCQLRGAVMALRQIHFLFQENDKTGGQGNLAAGDWRLQLPELVQELPGAMICLGEPPDLKLLGFSKGFLELCGYTREDVLELFQGKYVKMIFPDDLKDILDQIQKQIPSGGSETCQYRIIGKNGAHIWLSSRRQLVERQDGTLYFCSVLSDKTADRQARKALQCNLERYQIIASQTDDIIFEWDLEKDSISYSENWEGKFGCPAIPDPPDSSGIWNERIYPEDQPEMCRLMRSIRNGAPYDEAEIRLADRDGRYIWCRMRITLQSMEGEERRRAVGVIIDIDASMRQTQKLRRMAEQDILTGIYNRGKSQELITRILANLKPNEKAAFFLLDVDDFKQINDRYGHQKGDAVLSDVASVLQRTFRTGDVVGRIGGDEFCVFLSGVWDRRVLGKKAEDVLKVFRGFLTSKGRRRFSCSIGISVYPDDGKDYGTLFQNADIALYWAKEKGKNGYSFYQNKMGLPSRREEPTLAPEWGHDETAGSEERLENLENTMFRLLYRIENIEKALPILLELLGQKTGVSRVSLFEMQHNERYIWNSFEWCAPGIASKKQEYARVDVEEMEETVRWVREEGVFCVPDTLQMTVKDAALRKLEHSNVRAALYFPLRSGGKSIGAIGFDDCLGPRDWTREQKEMLAVASDIVGAFLFRYREKERAEFHAEGLIAALDCQRAWIYAVDPSTYELLYANEMARELRPDLRIGTLCCGKRFLAELPPEGRLVTVPVEGSLGILLGGLSDRCVEIIKKTIPWAGNRTACLITCYPMKGENTSHE